MFSIVEVGKDERKRFVGIVKSINKKNSKLGFIFKLGERLVG